MGKIPLFRTDRGMRASPTHFPPGQVLRSAEPTQCDAWHPAPSGPDGGVWWT